MTGTSSLIGVTTGSGARTREIGWLPALPPGRTLLFAMEVPREWEWELVRVGEGERESLALNGLHNEKYLDISLSFSHSLSVSISRPCGFATATTLSPPTVSEERRPVGAPPCRAKPLHVASERAEQDRVAYPGRGYILRSFAK